MPKQKTRKSIAKRFRVTKSGKVIRRQGFAGHLNSKKSSKTLRRLRRTKILTGSYAKKVRKVLGL